RQVAVFWYEGGVFYLVECGGRGEVVGLPLATTRRTPTHFRGCRGRLGAITDPDTLVGLCRQARTEGLTTTTVDFGPNYDEQLGRLMPAQHRTVFGLSGEGVNDHLQSLEEESCLREEWLRPGDDPRLRAIMERGVRQGQWDSQQM